MKVNPLSLGPGKIHGSIMSGKYYPQGYSTVQTQTVTTGHDMRIATLLLRTRNLTTSPQAAKYFTQFDCAVRLRVLAI